MKPFLVKRNPGVEYLEDLAILIQFIIHSTFLDSQEALAYSMMPHMLSHTRVILLILHIYGQDAPSFVSHERNVPYTHQTSATLPSKIVHSQLTTSFHFTHARHVIQCSFIRSD
jgi:hypothetical protein